MTSVGLSFGEMPSKADFARLVRVNAWPEGEPYCMTLRGDDAKVGVLADLPTQFDSPEEAYDGIEKLLNYADQEGDDTLRETAESLASSIMQTLGFEWV